MTVSESGILNIKNGLFKRKKFKKLAAHTGARTCDPSTAKIKSRALDLWTTTAINVVTGSRYLNICTEKEILINGSFNRLKSNISWAIGTPQIVKGYRFTAKLYFY